MVPPETRSLSLPTGSIVFCLEVLRWSKQAMVLSEQILK